MDYPPRPYSDPLPGHSAYRSWPGQDVETNGDGDPKRETENGSGERNGGSFFRELGMGS
jgi:hypothetical protein